MWIPIKKWSNSPEHRKGISASWFAWKGSRCNLLFLASKTRTEKSQCAAGGSPRYNRSLISTGAGFFEHFYARIDLNLHQMLMRNRMCSYKGHIGGKRNGTIWKDSVICVYTDLLRADDRSCLVWKISWKEEYIAVAQERGPMSSFVDLSTSSCLKEARGRWSMNIGPPTHLMISNAYLLQAWLVDQLNFHPKVGVAGFYEFRSLTPCFLKS